ncbi:hypothetical protein [Cupriavidus nantongensis]|uniref:Uncharacterized protein n=1 Tax=Cupriavidus nantongensis TaxID=1796606 RepID=A0A142JIV4_9BURK|nr:hypothetical protein [Cupriavidus nantongensis]AMR78016.1 hypothetical protein A2G96_09825 [Cupriavidus nantongensis]
MSNQNHPWIQDFASFEAVLCCTHELGQWEPSATLRAYQTYGFDDASTPGNDQTFRHIDTGVLLLHDGDVVAIQFGDGNLSAALSDLFLVLNALGWNEAEVFHPAETLAALLEDMGKAIPGHMDFDVKAAKVVSETGRVPEETALIERGKSLLHGVAVGHQEVQDFNALALGELESMAPDHAFQSVAATDTSVPQQPLPSMEAEPVSARVHLDDEFDIGIGDAIPGQSLSEPAHAIRPHGQVFLDDDDSGPVDLVLGASTLQSTAAHPSQNGGDDVYAGDGLSIDANVETAAQSNAVPVAAEEPRRVGQPAGAPIAHSVRIGHTESPPLPDAPIDTPVARVPTFVGRSGKGSAPQSLIRVGSSALSFDLPDAPVSLEEISQYAGQVGAIEVVHLWPGLIHQSERWDLVGEIDLNAPWFAEVVANELAPQCAVERVWFASALLQLARRQGPAQLRDMLVGLLKADGAESCGAISQAASLKPEAHERFVSLVLDRFSGLLLCQEGESFLDVRPADGTAAELGIEVRTFSVRSMVEAAEPKLYVIHLDATDGPFIAMIVRLLRGVAERYSISTRARTQAQALQREVERREATQREAERISAVEMVQSTMAGLMEQLKKAGIALPT